MRTSNKSQTAYVKFSFVCCVCVCLFDKQKVCFACFYLFAYLFVCLLACLFFVFLLDCLCSLVGGRLACLGARPWVQCHPGVPAGL